MSNAETLKAEILTVTRDAVASVAREIQDSRPRHAGHVWRFEVRVNKTSRGVEIFTEANAILDEAASRTQLNDARNAIAAAIEAHFGHPCDVAPGCKLMLSKVRSVGFWHMGRFNVSGYRRELTLKAA